MLSLGLERSAIAAAGPLHACLARDVFVSHLLHPDPRSEAQHAARLSTVAPWLLTSTASSGRRTWVQQTGRPAWSAEQRP